MGLFGNKPEPTIVPVRTISGRPQPVPDDYGGRATRRQRLFCYTVEVLRTLPESQAQAFGQPLGDGLGMEGLVAYTRPIFAREASLLRWVALRGALHGLWDAGAAHNDLLFLEAVGLRFEDGAGLRPMDPQLPPDLARAACGLAASIMTKVVDYDEISSLSIEDVRSDQRWRLSSFNQAMALDYIVWSSVVLCRLEAAGHIPPAPPYPEPSLLEIPGWYVDPLFGKAGRFWDGSDWTDRARLAPDHPRFRQTGELRSPL